MRRKDETVMKKKKSAGEIIFHIANYSLLTLLVFICFYPFWHSFMASFSDGDALIKHTGFMWKPAEFSLAAYERVMKNRNIWTGYMNTFFSVDCGGSAFFDINLSGCIFPVQRRCDV